MSPVPPARVRLTVAKRAVADVAMERDPSARLGKQVKDLPSDFVARFLRAQAVYTTLRHDLYVMLSESDK